MRLSGAMVGVLMFGSVATAATLIAVGTPASAPAAAKADEPRKCPKCAAAADDAWAYCPACGKKFPGGKPWYQFELNGDFVWLAIGFTGQLAFALRFFFQWLVSERRGESVIPPSFWYLSLVAGLMVLSYGIRNQEPIVILSQAFNPVIYIRNLMLIRKNDHHGMGTVSTAAAEEEAAAAPPPSK